MAPANGGTSLFKSKSQLRSQKSGGLAPKSYAGSGVTGADEGAVIVRQVSGELKPKALFDVDAARMAIRKRLEQCGEMVAKLGSTKKMRMLRESFEALVPVVLPVIDAAEAYVFVQRFGWLRTLETQFQNDEDMLQKMQKLQTVFEGEYLFRTELMKNLAVPREKLQAHKKLDEGFQESLLPRFDAWVVKLHDLMNSESLILDSMRSKLRPEIGFKLLASCHNDRRPLFKLIATELPSEKLAEYMLSMQYCARRAPPSMSLGLMPMLIQSLSPQQLETVSAYGFDSHEWEKDGASNAAQNNADASSAANIVASITGTPASPTRAGALFFVKAAHPALSKAAAECLVIVEREATVAVPVVEPSWASDGGEQSVGELMARAKIGENTARDGPTMLRWEKNGFNEAFDALSKSTDTYVFVQQSGWHKVLKEKFGETAKVDALHAVAAELAFLTKRVQSGAQHLTAASEASERELIDAYGCWKRQLDKMLALESALLVPLEGRMSERLTVELLTAGHKDWEFLLMFIMRTLEKHGLARELENFAVRLDKALLSVYETATQQDDKTLLEATQAARIRALPLVKKAVSPAMYDRLFEVGFVGIDPKEAEEAAAARRRTKSRGVMFAKGEPDSPSASMLGVISPRLQRAKSKSGGASGATSPTSILTKSSSIKSNGLSPKKKMSFMRK